MTSAHRMTTPFAFVGTDSGGIFTDFGACIDSRVRTHKVLSTPSDPAVAVLRGLRAVLPEHTSQCVTCASTVATNTLPAPLNADALAAAVGTSTTEGEVEHRGLPNLP